MIQFKKVFYGLSTFDIDLFDFNFDELLNKCDIDHWVELGYELDLTKWINE